jgi:hypothetical protein
VIVISVVVNTVDVVKDGVGGATLGVDVMAGALVQTEDEGIDTPGVLVGVVTALEDDVYALLGVDVGVVEGLVTTDELGTTGLLVVTEDGVLEKIDDEVDVSTLLVGVLIGKVEAGVEAD